MRVPRSEALSRIYHIVQRGNDRQLIFEEDHDRKRFLYNLQRFSEQNGVQILAWCLMSNHVHLLLEGELSSISKLMRTLSSEYAHYFNDKYECVGHLFQGRYLSEPIDTDEYLLAAIRYIHDNPSKAGLGEFWSYRWSSYSEYTDRPVLCRVEKVLNILGDVEAFEALHRKKDSENDAHDFLEDKSLRKSDDASLSNLAVEALGEMSFRNIKALPKPEREEALSKLRHRGLSIRQIERITGVGRGIISRCVL